MIYLDWKAGDKIVCVSNNFPSLGSEIGPTEGEVYTVRGMESDADGYLFVWLDEIRNRPRRYRDGWFECNFDAKAFRPVTKRTTDISIFTQMLNPSKVDA